MHIHTEAFLEPKRKVSSLCSVSLTAMNNMTIDNHIVSLASLTDCLYDYRVIQSAFVRKTQAFCHLSFAMIFFLLTPNLWNIDFPHKATKAFTSKHSRAGSNQASKMFLRSKHIKFTHGCPSARFNNEMETSYGNSSAGWIAVSAPIEKETALYTTTGTQ